MSDTGSRPQDFETSVVIVNFRTMKLTRDAIASVLPEAEVREVVVVDNASGDGSAEYLGDVFAGERVRVFESGHNRGFGPAVNLGASHCTSPLLLILNSDAALVRGSVGRLARGLVADDSLGVVAPAVYEPDGRTLQAGAYGRLPNRRDILFANGWTKPPAAEDSDGATPGWVSGVAMLLRRSDFEALGGFDEGFGMYFEDVDLCRRLRDAGKSVRRELTAGVVHGLGQSWQSRRDQRRRFHESKLRYFQKLGATRFEMGWVRLAGLIRTRMER